MIKKFIVLLSVATALCATPVNASQFPQDGEEFVDALAMWLPNLLLDTWDLFSLQVGAGPAVGLEGRITRYGNLGFMVGTTYDASKLWNRQLGVGQEQGISVGVGPCVYEVREMKNTSRLVEEYQYEKLDVIPMLNETIYDHYLGKRDIWAVELEGAVIIHVKGGLHPIELLDLVTGVFFFDLRGDNKTLTDMGAK